MLRYDVEFWWTAGGWCNTNLVFECFIQQNSEV